MPVKRKGILGLPVADDSDEDEDYVPEQLSVEDQSLQARRDQIRARRKIAAPIKKQSPQQIKAPAAPHPAPLTDPAVAVIAGGGATGSSLPPDVLRIIFQTACATSAVPTASSVACVCRAWRDIAVGLPELWANLDLSVHGLKATNTIVEENASSGKWHQVRHVKMVPRAPVIRNNKLIRAGLNESALVSLALHCAITSLDLSGWSVDGVPEFRAEGLEQAIRSMPALTALNVSQRVVIPRGTGIDRVVRAALTPRPGQEASPLATLKAASCPTLARSTVGLLCSKTRVHRHMQQQLPQEQPEELGVPSVAPQSIPEAHVPTLLHLREVDLSLSGNLDSSMWLSPERLQANAPHLEVFRATGLGGVFGWQVPNTEYSWQGSPGWPSLKVLALGTGELQGSFGLSSLSNNLLLRFAGKSLKLTHLEISGCAFPALRPNVLSDLAGASHLRVLEIRRSSLASDDGLVHIAAHCPSLEKLDASASRGAIGDVGLFKLAQGCHQLKCLDVAGSAIKSQAGPRSTSFCMPIAGSC